MERMTCWTRRRPWWAIGGGLCLLAVAVGWLARPTDDLAGVMELRPHTAIAGDASDPGGGYTWLWMDFNSPPAAVLHRLPALRPPGYAGRLSDGRSVALFLLNGTASGPCVLIVEDRIEPWYVRAWGAIRARAGLS